MEVITLKDLKVLKEMVSHYNFNSSHETRVTIHSQHEIRVTFPICRLSLMLFEVVLSESASASAAVTVAIAAAVPAVMCAKQRSALVLLHRH
jgi:hypothetical protein